MLNKISFIKSELNKANNQVYQMFLKNLISTTIKVSLASFAALFATSYVHDMPINVIISKAPLIFPFIAIILIVSIINGTHTSLMKKAEEANQ